MTRFSRMRGLSLFKGKITVLLKPYGPMQNRGAKIMNQLGSKNKTSLNFCKSRVESIALNSKFLTAYWMEMLFAGFMRKKLWKCCHNFAARWLDLKKGFLIKKNSDFLCFCLYLIYYFYNLYFHWWNDILLWIEKTDEFFIRKRRYSYEGVACFCECSCAWTPLAERKWGVASTRQRQCNGLFEWELLSQ